MNFIRRSLATMFVAGIAALGGVGTASAASIIQSFSEPAAPVPVTYTFLANQFSPSKGTLNSVVITITSDITGAVDVYNFTGASQNFTHASASVPVTLTGPDGLSLNVTASTPFQMGTVGKGTFYPGLGYVGEASLPGQAVTASVSTTLTTSAQLMPYIGSGVSSLSFVFDADTGTYQGSAKTGVSFGGSATADASVTIVYNYTPAVIPEPSSFVLLGLGGVGSLVGRRALRRRRSA